MTLSQRTILIIVSTFIALLVVIAVTSDVILLSSYSKLEKSQLTSHVQHILNQIVDKQKLMDFNVQEVAAELSSGSLQTSKNMFTEHYMRSHSLDLAAVYDASGRLVTISGFDCEENEVAPVSEIRKNEFGALVLKLDPNRTGALMGVVSIDDLPLIIAMMHIRDSNNVKQGTAVVGWFIDKIEMERIFRASGSNITVYNQKGLLPPDVNSAAVAMNSGATFIHTAVINNSSVAGYFTLKDILGEPLFIVRAVENRILYEQGKVTIAYILLALFVAGAVLCSVMLVFVRGTILSRLQSLTTRVHEITEIKDISARMPLSEYQDELNTLTVSINSMLESLENAESGMRESEERYRMLFDRAPDAIIIIGLEGDEAGCVVAANQAAADQHGYTLDEICRLRISDLNTAETNKISGDLMATVCAGEWLTAEMWHQKKDGSQFPIEVHAGLIKIGNKKYILGFDRDITQRKLTEETDHMHLEQIGMLNEQLSSKARKLAAANNELETFNYSVSHDMRGPLTRISGYCQLLLEDDTDLDPRVREYIARIYESEIWLNDMIDALLHLAQLTRVDIVPVNVNMSDIAVSVLQELALECPERTVRTVVGMNIVAPGDARLLKMVMINLLGNAWKYSALKNETQIEFGVEQSKSGPVYFVRDNGAGFNMKDAGKLFRVFTRLHDASEFAGTGIGLATVQRIIFRHGGRVWAEAEPGVGATFFFTLS
jgi:PAS domain S-box-containing protein